MSTVTLFHGTTQTNAKRLLKQKRWDPQMFGRGADVNFVKGKTGISGMGQRAGFYGPGLYLTSTPNAASTYAQLRSKGAVLEVDVDGDQIVWADSLTEDEILTHKMKTIVEGRRQRSKHPLAEEELESAARAELASESDRVKTIRDLAETKGLGGVAYSPYEIVVWGNLIEDVRTHGG